MLSICVLVVVALVTIGAVTIAARERLLLGREVDAFVRGIELRTESEEDVGSPSEAEDGSAPAEIADLLDEVVQTEDHRLAAMAAHEFTGRAALARTRATSFSRGLSRIGLLSGAAGGFAAAALGSFDKQSMVLAAGSVSMGLVCSFVAHGLTSRLRATAKRYSELTDILAKQVESHFSEGT